MVLFLPSTNYFDIGRRLLIRKRLRRGMVDCLPKQDQDSESVQWPVRDLLNQRWKAPT